jgi:DNA-binding response OmpR family regulator
MRILIVEDEPALGNLLKSNLEAESYAVDLARDGDVGLQSAKTNNYDAIVLDDILPGKRGGEICAELRRRGQTMPILFMSVRAGTDEKVNSLDLGADDYLAKPFSYSEMSARLRALLRRPRTFQAQELRVDDLIFDESAASVVRDGKKIYLTAKESALLKYLMMNAGTLVTRAMIFEHVWDEEADQLSSMIETHIYNLRRKLDGPGMEQTIKTISGRGYILLRKI